MSLLRDIRPNSSALQSIQLGEQCGRGGADDDMQTVGGGTSDAADADDLIEPRSGGGTFKCDTDSAGGEMQRADVSGAADGLKDGLGGSFHRWILY